MKYTIQKGGHPAYLQLYQQLRDDILSAVYPFAGRLPSKRLLADELGISTITIEHAYALLCEEGYVEARERSGYFVIFQQADGFAASAPELRPRMDRAAPSYPGFSPSLLSKTMRRILTEDRDALLEKSPNAGLVELRSAIRQYLARNRGIQVEIDQIIIGSGAEYLYRLIVDLLGRDAVYAIETPSYDKIEQIYRSAGAKCELLPLSGDGIDSEALAATTANVLHTTPYRSFPTGVSASATKRHEYIRWASRGNRLIIESDYGSEFSIGSKPVETLFVISNQKNVIYLNTFSKTISPAMRMGYMVLPRHLVQTFEDKLGFYSCTVPTFEQLVLTELINNGDFERHINRVRRNKRRELASEA